MVTALNLRSGKMFSRGVGLGGSEDSPLPYHIPYCQLCVLVTTFQGTRDGWSMQIFGGHAYILGGMEPRTCIKVSISLYAEGGGPPMKYWGL